MNDYINYSKTKEEALKMLWSDREKFEELDKLDQFEEMEKEIKEVPVLNLTLALEFSDTELLEIYKKVREVFETLMFVNFSVDPNLIGGCVVIWQGKVYDWSIKKSIVDKRKEFLEILYGSGLR